MDEWVEARIWEKGVLKSSQYFRGNTILINGKYELANLLCGLDSKTIDAMFAIVGTTIEIASSNSRSGNTLNVATSTAYTTAGTYSAIMTGNSSQGDDFPYNSISIDIALPGGSELDFTIRWVFTGADPSFFADEICASRLGKIGDAYDYPIATVAIFDGGVIQAKSGATFNVLVNGTFYVGQSSPFGGANLFDSLQFITSQTTANRFFDKIDGFTVDVSSGQTVDTLTEIVLG